MLAIRSRHDRGRVLQPGADAVPDQAGPEPVGAGRATSDRRQLRRRSSFNDADRAVHHDAEGVSDGRPRHRARPVWLYQLWAFVAPGLHRNEKKYTYAFVAAAVPLFAAGAYLAYVILPVSVKVLLELTPDGCGEPPRRSTTSSTSPCGWCSSSGSPSSCRCCWSCSTSTGVLTGRRMARLVARHDHGHLRLRRRRHARRPTRSACSRWPGRSCVLYFMARRLLAPQRQAPARATTPTPSSTTTRPPTSTSRPRPSARSSPCRQPVRCPSRRSGEPLAPAQRLRRRHLRRGLAIRGNHDRRPDRRVPGEPSAWTEPSRSRRQHAGTSGARQLKIALTVRGGG